MSTLIRTEDAIKCCEENAKSLAEEIAGELEEFRQKVEKQAKKFLGFDSMPRPLSEILRQNTANLALVSPANWTETIPQPAKEIVGRMEIEISPALLSGALLAVAGWAAGKAIDYRRKSKAASCEKCVKKHQLSQKSKVRRVKCQGFKFTRITTNSGKKHTPKRAPVDPGQKSS